MGFWKRFRLYLFGFGLGLLFVYGVFGDRDVTSWLPERKILTAIDSSVHAYTPIALCELECNGFGPDDIHLLMEKADIDFGESEVDAEPCPIYHITSQDENYVFTWEVCESEEKVKLISFESGKSCDC